MEPDASVVLPLVVADVTSASKQANDFLKLYVAPPYTSFRHVDPHELTIKLQSLEDVLNSLPAQLLSPPSEPVAEMLLGVQDDIGKVRKRYDKLLGSVRDDIAKGKSYETRKWRFNKKKWRPKDLSMSLQHVKDLIEMAAIRLEPLRSVVSLTTRFFDATEYLIDGGLSPAGPSRQERLGGGGRGGRERGEAGRRGRRRRTASPMSTVTSIMSTGSWGGYRTGGNGENDNTATTTRSTRRIRTTASHIRSITSLGPANTTPTHTNNNNNSNDNSSSDNASPPSSPPCLRPATGVHLNDDYSSDENLGGGVTWDASTRRSQSMVQPETISTLSVAPALRSTHAQDFEDKQHAEDIYRRALSYFYGTDVAQNQIRAIELFQESVDLGHPPAMYMLATHYENGIEKVLEKNNSRAAELYEKAAFKGVKYNPKTREAFYKLACCLDEGFGIAKDEQRAIDMYQRASEIGHAMASYKLGQIYFNGRGVTVNKKRAYDMFFRASSGGIGEGTRMLAYYYENGVGETPVMKKRAVEMYEQAGAEGDEEAKERAKVLRRKWKRSFLKKEDVEKPPTIVDGEERNRRRRLF